MSIFTRVEDKMQQSGVVNWDLNKANYWCVYSVTGSIMNRPHRDHVNTEWIFQGVEIRQVFPFLTSTNMVLPPAPCLPRTSCGSQQERMVFSPPVWWSLTQGPTGVHTHLHSTQGREATTWAASSCSSFHLRHSRGMRVQEMQWRNSLNSEEKKQIWGFLPAMLEIWIWEWNKSWGTIQINETWRWRENVLHNNWNMDL